MRKFIHQSWLAHADPSLGSAPSSVAFDFEGRFAEGSFAGAEFRGQLRYDRAVDATAQHLSFAFYDEWHEPIVTLAVAGHDISSHGAAVYARVYDGVSSHHDFVTIHGAGRFDGIDDGASFEVLFASKDVLLLDDTRLPSARQLRRFAVRQVSFSTSQPGNVISRGELTLFPIDHGPLVRHDLVASVGAKLS